MIDRRALAAYRQRLRQLDEDCDEADRHDDLERRSRLIAERQGLLDEIGRVTRSGGQRREFANYPAERARKAVAARIRDAIRRLQPILPELAVHLDKSIVTGTYCRYRPEDARAWTVEP
jgi:hypothetical protein